MKNPLGAQNKQPYSHHSSTEISPRNHASSKAPLTSKEFALPLRRVEIVLFIFLGIMHHIALGGGRFTVALSSVAYGYSSFMTGFFIACFAIAPMLLSFKAGKWIHQVGVRKPIFIAPLLASLGMLLTFIYPCFLIFMIAPLLIGSGFMLYQLSTQHLFGFMASPERRLQNFAWLSLGYSASAFIGPPIAGYVIHVVGFQAAFGVLCIFPLISAGIIYSIRGYIPQRLIDPNALPSLQSASETHSLSDLLSNKGFRTLMFMNLLIAGSFDTNQFLLPLYGRGIALTEYQIGLIVGTFAVASFIVRMFLPIIQRFISHWNIVRIAASITAACFFLFPLLHSVAGLFALAFILGMALGSCQPNLLSLVYTVVPTTRISEAIGVRLSILNTSQVVLPIIFGLLLDIIGFIPIFWLMALVLVMGAKIKKAPSNQQIH